MINLSILDLAYGVGAVATVAASYVTSVFSSRGRVDKVAADLRSHIDSRKRDEDAIRSLVGALTELSNSFRDFDKTMSIAVERMDERMTHLERTVYKE